MRRRLLLLTLAATAALGACTSGAGTPPRVSTAPTGSADVPSSTASTSLDPTPAPATPGSGSRRATPIGPRTSPPRSPAATSLPLRYPTGAATQVVTVVAGATTDTRATLQAWRRTADGWHRVGPAVRAWLGSAGMTARPSEQVSAVPMGSWTLTQAFGHDANPGTSLPYTRTTPADWWISQGGPLYNTLKHCSAECAFVQGDPNEHLYYETPFYDYAMVIDYNRDPVRQGAGSAFFVHVSVGRPTAGCVALPKAQLVALMQWLTPSAHPRILIGTA